MQRCSKLQGTLLCLLQRDGHGLPINCILQFNCTALLHGLQIGPVRRHHVLSKSTDATTRISCLRGFEQTLALHDGKEGEAVAAIAGLAPFRAFRLCDHPIEVPEAKSQVRAILGHTAAAPDASGVLVDTNDIVKMDLRLSSSLMSGQSSRSLED